MGFHISLRLGSETFYPEFSRALTSCTTILIATAAPGVQQRFNAIQKFVDGAAPGTQVIYAPRPEAGQTDPLPQALHEAGMDLSIADQDGGYQRALGQDGQAHGIAIVRDIEAAPHESRHAMDDVLGRVNGSAN